MSEKKNIDRLFQEKFKDFEASPPEFVWENLEEILQEKKKRRVVPLWWRMGGIAAALVVGMLFLYPFFTGNTPDTDAGRGVVYDNQDATQGKGNNKPAASGAEKGRLLPNPDIKSEGPGNPGAVVTAPRRIVEGDGKHSGAQAPGSKFQKPVSGAQNNNAYASHGKGNPANNKGKGVGNKAINGSNHYPATHNNQPQTGIAGNNPASSRNENEGRNNTEIATGQPTVKNEGLAQNDTPQGTANNPGQGIENRAAPDPEKLAPAPIAPEQAIAEAAVDSVQENELDKLQREQKEQKEALAQNNKGEGDAKWNVKPQLGPLLYSSMTSGSPIDGQFSSNSKSFDNQMSYGVGVDYALTDRLSFRSGVNTVNLSYATEGVQFYASLNQGTNNVARTSSNANIVVQNLQSMPIVPTNSFMNSDQLPKETFNGSMVQSTGYIEVPLEMSYALMNKKFGIDVIGGFSTLFLNENNVSVVSNQGLSTNVGRAQNLNDISFSTNLGLGFTYRFFKQFKASFEPTFKYQVNPYTRDAGNFRPYFVGLYTGISFSF